MLKTNGDGQYHFRDVFLDQVCVRALEDISDLNRRDADEVASEKLSRAIARLAHDELQKQSQEPPVQILLDETMLGAMHNLGWINIKSATHSDVEEAAAALLVYALSKRLHAADCARDAVISQMLEKFKNENRSPAIAGLGAQVQAAQREYVNRRAAE